MAYSACLLGPPGSGRQNQSSSSPPFLTRFLSDRHISAVFASFSGLSPPSSPLFAHSLRIPWDRESLGRRWLAPALYVRRPVHDANPRRLPVLDQRYIVSR